VSDCERFCDNVTMLLSFYLEAMCGPPAPDACHASLTTPAFFKIPYFLFWRLGAQCAQCRKRKTIVCLWGDGCTVSEGV
jgi:hypothetical protein